MQVPPNCSRLPVALSAVVLALLSPVFCIARAAPEPGPVLADVPHADFADFDRRAKAGERLNVVFFGASLTWGANATDPQLTSYRAVIGRRLEEAYPSAHFTFWDGAIGGTGSQLGVFRLERDVLRHKPDLVFLDFSANDGISSATPETLASYEAIVRRIIRDGHAPVVQVIFPFKWDVERGTTDGMLRRDAHLAIAAAYHTAAGDAIELAQRRVKAGATTIGQLWPVDGVHPGNDGYNLFADAAWDAFRKAVDSKVACVAPEHMLHAPTYMTSARVRIATLAPLPAGWKVGHPNLTSAFFDMLMSRWLDDEVIAGKDAQRLKVTFHGAMVMVFGETTPKSGTYRVYVDGKPTPRKSGDGKVLAEEFDGGELGKRVGGNAHLTQVLVEGLDPTVAHTLEIEPTLKSADGELRFESICVAGGEKPSVTVAH